MLQSSVYVGLSGQLSLQRRLDTIANNIANTSTAGYRAEEIKFEALLSKKGETPVAFASSGASFISRRSGEIVPTGNPLDLAVNGNAWLSIQTPAGVVYTRDGRLRMLPTGELETLNGYPVLDNGGANITIDPRGGPPEIGPNGVIRQAGRQTGQIGLFTIAENANITRFDNSGVLSDTPAEPVTDFNAAKMAQGFVERSNANPVTEITRLISVSRAFDALSNILSDTENSLRSAIETLGSSSR